MGKTLTGSTKKTQVGLTTPQQNQFLSTAGTAFEQFLQPQDNQQAFQQGFVDPALQTLRRDILPQIGQNFSGANAGSSSALNLALSRAAEETATGIGNSFGQFQQNQQQQQLGAAQGLGNLALSPVLQNIITQNPGILGDLIGAAGTVGAGAFISSRAYKDNIKSYDKGIDELKKLEVKSYDYKKEYGGQKGQVGLIAEDVPRELQADINGKLGINIYGVVGLLVNAVKDLNLKLESRQ